METSKQPDYGVRENDTVVSTRQPWMKKLPDLLRLFGSIAVLFSLYSFLVRGWEGSSDLVRYFMLLGHTGALAGIGLASGHFLKEARGARLLLTLALVSVPVNFAILGAFLYSAFGSAGAMHYPAYVAWSVGTGSAAVLAMVVALLVLVPVIYVGFLTLARGISREMIQLYLVSNVLMLLPLRDAYVVAAMAGILAVFILVVSARIAARHTEVKTREGMMALLLQFLPVGILLGRNIWLYAPESIVYTMTLLVTFVALRQCALYLQENIRFRSIAEMASLLVALLTGISSVTSFILVSAETSMAIMAGSFVAAGMVYELSMRACRYSTRYRIFAMIILVSSLLINLLMFDGLRISLVSMLSGLLLIVFSYRMQQRSMFIAGVVATVAGALHQFIQIMQSFDFGYWLVTAIAGVLAIVIASFIESEGGRLRQLFASYRARYGDWNY